MQVIQFSDRVAFPSRSQAAMASYLNDAELLMEISAIASSPSSFEEAVERITRLLERQRGLSGLVVLEKRGASSIAVARGGEHAPPAGLLSLPIREGGAEIGELRIAFRIQQSNQAQSLVLAAFVAEQIGALLALRHLSERRTALKAGLDRLRRELAAVKVVSRAVGLLASKQRWSERAARDWLELQSRKNGLPLHAVADRVVTHHLSEPSLAAGLPNLTSEVQDLAADDPAGVDFTPRRKTA